MPASSGKSASQENKKLAGLQQDSTAQVLTTNHRAKMKYDQNI
jgi:hypothetical protein